MGRVLPWQESVQLLEESSCKNINKLGRKGVILQLIEKWEFTTEPKLPEPLKGILQQFGDVFQDPKGLPPHRSHDHAINLLHEAKPMSVRPYRYPFFQKYEIEKIVQELLNSGMIQPNQIPYSSPVLLVKKAYGSWRMRVDYKALN